MTEAENYLSQATEPTNNIKEHRFVYGPNNRLIGEYQADGNIKQDIIRLCTIPVATVDANGAIHYIHTDHLGTPRAATSPNGEVVWSWISSPFGDTKANEDVDGNGNSFTLNLRFPGQYFDEETELHYNYFRDYDPGTGRYVQSDPVGLSGGLNVYAYVENNPITLVDPDGLRPTKNPLGPDGKPIEHSCKNVCYVNFLASSLLAGGVGSGIGALIKGSGVGSAVLHHASGANAAYGVFDLASCLDNCDEGDECK